MLPKKGETCKLKDIFAEGLEPANITLFVDWDGEGGDFIICSSLTSEQVLSVAGFGETTWKYISPTVEGNHLFEYWDKCTPITRFIDVVHDSYKPWSPWITLKEWPQSFGYCERRQDQNPER